MKNKNSFLIEYEIDFIEYLFNLLQKANILKIKIDQFNNKSFWIDNRYDLGKFIILNLISQSEINKEFFIQNIESFEVENDNNEDYLYIEQEYYLLKHLSDCIQAYLENIPRLFDDQFELSLNWLIKDKK